MPSLIHNEIDICISQSEEVIESDILKEIELNGSFGASSGDMIPPVIGPPVITSDTRTIRARRWTKVENISIENL